jgi:hypothetical protein
MKSNRQVAQELRLFGYPRSGRRAQISNRREGRKAKWRASCLYSLEGVYNSL